jgi:hypothetical protein
MGWKPHRTTVVLDLQPGITGSMSSCSCKDLQSRRKVLSNYAMRTWSWPEFGADYFFDSRVSTPSMRSSEELVGRRARPLIIRAPRSFLDPSV